jgi:hypothetical protein
MIHRTACRKLSIEQYGPHKYRGRTVKNCSLYIVLVILLLCTRCLVRLYLQLFVGGCMSYLRYLCLFACGGVQHISCCVFIPPLHQMARITFCLYCRFHKMQLDLELKEKINIPSTSRQHCRPNQRK